MEKFTAKVIEKKNITPEIILLTLEVPIHFKFEPGQYLVFMINDGKETKPRPYSIFSYENENGKLRFIIKLISGGFASEVFRKMSVNDTFEVKGAMGHFTFVNEDNEEYWFIGCGCGLAPLYSMIKSNLDKFPEKKFVLLLSMKTKQDLLFYEELKAMEEKYTNFTFLPTLTREEWEGKSGRVQKYLPEDCSKKMFYICGVKELIFGTKDLLLEKGVAPERIKFERYS